MAWQRLRAGRMLVRETSGVPLHLGGLHATSRVEDVVAVACFDRRVERRRRRRELLISGLDGFELLV